MKEIWRDVKGYEGDYQVSDLGRVKSLKFGKEKIMKQFLSTYGYKRINFCKNNIQKTKEVHQLVAIAFLNHKPNGSKIVVDHINNDRLNNRLSNIQLVSQRKNTSKDKTGGSSKFVGVSWKKAIKKWQANIQIKGKCKHLGYFYCELEAAKTYQDALKEL